MTPLIPIQTYFLLATWVICRPIPFLNFNAIIAIAWIWVTNPLTMVPLYFIFYVTGQLILGQWNSLIQYDVFIQQIEDVISNGSGQWDKVQEVTLYLIREPGMILAVGSAPYAIFSGWAGYTLSLRYLRQRARRRANPAQVNE